MEVNKLLQNRKEIIKLKQEKFPNYHFFSPVINNSDFYSSFEEKIIMYMMYNLTLEGIGYSVTGKDTLYLNTLKKYEELKKKIVHDKGKLLLKSLEFPLRAHYYYKKKDYNKADDLLIQAIKIYSHIFDNKNQDIIWASLEQSLNRIRILIEQGLPFIERVGQIIDEVYNAEPNGNAMFSTKMTNCIHKIDKEEVYDSLNKFLDSVIIKIQTKYFSKDKNVGRTMIKSFINTLIKTEAYNHLKVPFEPYLNDESLKKSILLNSFNEFTEIPSTLESLLISSLKGYENSPDEINNYLLATYNIKLK